MDDEIETGTDYLVSVILVPKIELDIDPDDKVRGFTPPSDTRCISWSISCPSAGIQITRIKEKVEEQSGVPPQQQRLIFSGRQMCVYKLECVV
jgi:hypothetical protein